MDLREVGYDDRDWINLAQNRDRWRAYCRNSVSSHDDGRVEQRKILPGTESGFSALRAAALSTKPHRIPIPVSD
ncbi:hypothetical protein ANN_16322 [Periplaneta americana]|uniref:Uncharacterized protein n=1 Tax=Periplaneta americana TaxID=6978 RepID=A0ABQ8SJ41_PERAM|nr:hypothetical protein ANN_16322 [Periplaneta americana]